MLPANCPHIYSNFIPSTRYEWEQNKNVVEGLLTGGLNHLFRRIIFSIHGHGKWFLNCISFLWP